MEDICNFLFDTVPDLDKKKDSESVQLVVDDLSRGELERYLRILGISQQSVYEEITALLKNISLDMMPNIFVRYWYDFFNEEYREDLSEIERRKWLLDLLSKVKRIGTALGIIERIESWTEWTVEIYLAYAMVFKSNSSLTPNWIDYSIQITNKDTYLDAVHRTLGEGNTLKNIVIHVWTSADPDYNKKIIAMEDRLDNYWLPVGVTYLWVKED